MAVNLINIGNIANDGTGDDLREAFVKVNQNFEELDLRQPESTTARNDGIGEGLFSKKLGAELVFKGIKADPSGKVFIESNDSDITLGINPAQLLYITDSGTVTLDNILDDNIVRIKGYINGDDGTRNTWVGLLPGSNDIVVRSYTTLKDDFTPELSGTLNGNQQNITNVNSVEASSITGSFFGNVYGVDVRNLGDPTFDFGGVNPVFSSPIQYLLDQNPIDLGTFTAEDGPDINLGSI